MTKKFKRFSVSLDDASHDKCKFLADEMATTVSGVLQILVKYAYDNQKHIFEEQRDLTI